jgi:hypothetical protein
MMMGVAFASLVFLLVLKCVTGTVRVELLQQIVDLFRGYSFEARGEQSEYLTDVGQ